MENKTKERIGFTADVLSLGQFVWGLVSAAIFSALAAVMSWLFGMVEPVERYGWAAQVLAGIGLSCLIAFGLSALMFGANAAAAGYRRIRPLPTPPPPAPLVPPLPTLADYEDAALEKRVAALERDVREARSLLERARKAIEDNSAAVAKFGPSMSAAVADATAGLRKEVDEVKAAMQAAAEAMREENAARFEMIRKTAEHALGQGRQREEAFKAVLGALRDEYGPKFEGLDGKIDEYAERLGERLRGLEARAEASERRILDMFRARDDLRRLRRLDAEAAELFGVLFHADERKYRGPQAWLTDYMKWKHRIIAFWDTIRRHSESVGQPFALTDSDFGGRDGVPDNGLFATNDMRVTYQIMLVVNERHKNLAERAFTFMEDKGTPPRA